MRVIFKFDIISKPHFFTFYDSNLLSPTYYNAPTQAADGRDANIPVITVTSGNEPSMFTAQFMVKKSISHCLNLYVSLLHSLSPTLSLSLSLAISLSSTCRFLCKPCCRPSPPLRPNPPSHTLTLPPPLTLQAWDDELAKGNKFEDIYEKRKQQLSAHKEKENATRPAPLISANPSLIAEPVPAPVPVEVPVVVPVVVTPTPEPVAPIVPAEIGRAHV